MAKIKICGIKSLDDVAVVNAAMPDYIGFVFAEGSRRFVPPPKALELRARLNEGIVTVGVFVNAPIALIEELFSKGAIQIAQLHGGESGEYIAALKSAGIPVIQAIRDGRGGAASSDADYYLFDGAEGGSGAAFDWKTIDWKTIRQTDKPAFLAGGINAGNIRAALAIKPYAVDVSSGAEAGGVKDMEKTAALVRIVRGGV